MTVKRENLIPIDNKLYQKCKAHLLPTDKASTLRLHSNNGGLSNDVSLRYNASAWNPMHIYITSNEKIKEGDFVLELNTERVKKASRFTSNVKDVKIDILHFSDPKFYRKIIAATDTSLYITKDYKGRRETKEEKICYSEYLPQPSQDFLKVYIEKYNKGEQIINVLVEYKNINKGFQQLANQKDIGTTIIPDDYQLKIDKNNTITIKAVKDSWNREEVIRLMQKAGLLGAKCERRGLDYNELFLDLIYKEL